MSLLPRKHELPYPTYDKMLDYILSEIQDRLETSIDDLIQKEDGINTALLNRMNQIARNVHHNLKLDCFTYDEMVEILESEDTIITYKGNNNILFSILKPVFEIVDTENGKRLAITMALDTKSIL